MKALDRARRAARKGSIRVFSLILVAAASSAAFGAELSIGNADLLFETGNAQLIVNSTAASVNWTVKKASGAVEDSGTAAISSGTATIDLDGLDPNFYLLTLSASGATTINTSLGVIDNLSTVPNQASSQFGTSAHVEIWPELDYAGLLRKAGLGFLRIDMRWAVMEQATGVYDFSPHVVFGEPFNIDHDVDYDAIVSSLTTAGIKPLVILGYPNELHDDGLNPHTPAGYEAFADYVTAVADRYGDSIDYEIWNEFNHIGEERAGPCGQGPECYLPILQEAVTAIRAEAPSAKIAMSGLAGWTANWLGGSTAAPEQDFVSRDWLEGFLDLDGADEVDVINIHNYALVYATIPYFTAPEGNNDLVIEDVKELLSGYPSASGKPLWLTETSWFTNLFFGVNEATQANYLVRDAALSLSKGVDRYQWYPLIEDTPGDPWGLLHAVETHPAIAPKQAFVAQAVLTRQLDGYAYSSTDTLGSGLYSIVFTKSGSPARRILWSTSKLPSAVYVASNANVSVTSTLGPITTASPSSGAAFIELSDRPIYVSGSGVTGVTQANRAAGQSVTSSSNDGTHLAAFAVDNDAETYWQGASASYPNTLTVDLGASYSVSHLKVSIPPSFAWRYQTFSVQTSTNGSTYSTSKSSAQYQFGSSNGNTVTVSLSSPVNARYVRLSFTANSVASAGQVSNLAVYGL